ncbi:hypothetical protein Q9R20_14525 [Microbacterium sp. PRF11]|uniref:hypothetical protein n=1 Tax=Microbacterium sp. PRF11 TaxID=2962593 RepID=UPI00288160C4|nr:hypothetical protein [Microbacterium sp. PRF11]MDT0118195.1 hypothetical protein [Microbacterium sp. PRF11]
MGVTKERRHASRAVRKERRYRQMYSEYARRAGIGLVEWQIDVLIAYALARESGGTFV